MNRTLLISASGMEAQQVRTDTIANNMANVSTSAFKRGVSNFQDMLYQKMAAPGSDSSTTTLPVGIQLGTGVRTSYVAKDFTQGSLQASSSDLDIAIEGDGFFPITMPDGSTTYTRAGNFHMDSTGKVVTAEGYAVQGFPTLDTNATSITVTSDGTVSVYVNGTNSSKGQIQLARVPNPEGMDYIGHNLYRLTDASGTALLGTAGSNNFGNLAQHYTESSNVEIITEMVDLIAAQRAYELNSKSIKNSDQMLSLVNNLKM
ncbi:MAG: Flagellar basal-body rod protein FlgG [Syntrophorhabdus sp. PtaU1.Bin153]|nr:MAG: Flagellar basal-body rod protein FlgG [Syntrophorhabdus sp. PtaU1.Bin153]